MKNKIILAFLSISIDVRDTHRFGKKGIIG
jgi:hypothetical protein